ncbi:MAG: dihydrofolate reductase family protein [Verrucomicrobiota bacterium]
MAERPKVTAIAAQSLDGFITRHEEPGTGFTSAGDQRWFREALQGFDSILMGRLTYEASRKVIRRRLSVERPRLVWTHRPEAFAAEAVDRQLIFASGFPAELLEHLSALGCTNTALLGGGQVYSAFLQADLIDALWLTLEPRIFGEGTPAFPGRHDAHFRLERHETLADDTLLIRYQR